MDKEKTSDQDLQDLLEWSKDARGDIFWAEIKELFADGMSKLRISSESGNAIDSARYAAHVRTLEEVLQLPRLIIQQAKSDQEDAKEEGQ